MRVGISYEQTLEKKVQRLEDENEQLRIQLQALKDELHDARAELEATNWDRPIH